MNARDHSPAPRAVLVAVTLFVLSLAYFVLFLRYGINLEDEGTLLYQFERMADGQRAYTEFHVGYTPGVYWLHSTLQGWFDESIMPGRIALALTNATSVALLGVLVAPFVGTVAAILAGLCFLAIPPVNPGFFASFNVPYPTWYSVTIFLLGCVVCRGFLSQPTFGRALVAGAVAGVAFLFKPNIGAFQLAFSMLLILSAVQWRRAGTGAAFVFVWWWFVWISTGAAVFAVFGFVPKHGEFWTFLLPVVLCSVLCARRAKVAGATMTPLGVFAVTAAVGIGFCAVNVPWIAYYAMRVPLDVLLREVFFVGSDYADFFFRPHPDSFKSALLLAVAAAAVAMAPRWLRTRLRHPAWLFVVVFVVAFTGLAFVINRRPMIEGFYPSLMDEAEGAWIYAASLAAHLLAIVFLLTTPSKRLSLGRTRGDALFVITVGSVFLYLQIYPRTDFMHWVTASPLFVAAVFCLAAVGRDKWVSKESRVMRTAVLGICLFPLLFIAGLRFERHISTIVRFEDGRIAWRPDVELAASRAPVWMNIGKAERYRDIDAVVSLLDRVSAPTDKVLMFPSLDLLSFLADRHSPIGDTYLFPGWVGHDDEAVMLDQLRASPPAFVVVHHELWPFFDRASLYFYELTTYFEHEYRRLAQIGRFAILVRKDLDVTVPSGGEISWHSPDPRLQRYVTERLASPSAAERRRALSQMRADLIEGSYDSLNAALSEDQTADAAVLALLTAENEHVGKGLLQAAMEGKLSARAQSLALRRGSVWAGRESVPLLMAMAGGTDPVLADSGAAGLGAAAHRNLLRSFWPFMPADAGLDSLALSNPQRVRIRSWLREPSTDSRIKTFAVAVAGDAGGLSEVRESGQALCQVEAERRRGSTSCETQDAIDCDSEAGAALGLKLALDQFVPQPITRAALVYELARARERGALELALDYVSVDDLLAPRSVLVALGAAKTGDEVLAERIRTSAQSRYREDLLAIGETRGGCATVAAAESVLAENLEPSLEAAVRRVSEARNRLCPRES